MSSAEPRRWVDSFDHLRTHSLIWALIELLEGGTRPVHEILCTDYLEWQSMGDILRPPEDMNDPEAALWECYDVLYLVRAMSVGNLHIDAPDDCRAVEVERYGAPRPTGPASVTPAGPATRSWAGRSTPPPNEAPRCPTCDAASHVVRGAGHDRLRA